MLSCFILRNYKANNTSIFKTNLRPVYTCNFWCDFQRDFRLLMDENEQMSYECSEYMFLHLNIYKLIHSFTSIRRRNRTRNRTFVNVGAFTPFFQQFFRFYFIKKLLKFTKSCKNEIYLQEIIKSKNVCYFAAVMQSL